MNKEKIKAITQSILWDVFAVAVVVLMFFIILGIISFFAFVGLKILDFLWRI